MDKSAKYKHRNTMHYYVCHSNLDIKIEDRLIIGNFGNKGQIVTWSPFSSLISRKKKKKILRVWVDLPGISCHGNIYAWKHLVCFITSKYWDSGKTRVKISEYLWKVECVMPTTMASLCDHSSMNSVVPSPARDMRSEVCFTLVSFSMFSHHKQVF